MNDSKSFLKVSGWILIALAVWELISTAFTYTMNKTQVIDILKQVDIDNASANTTVSANTILIIIIVSVIVVTLVRTIIGARAVSQANGNVKAKAHTIFALIFAVFGILGIISGIKDFSNINWVSFLINCVTTLAYLFIFIFGTKIKNENNE